MAILLSKTTNTSSQKTICKTKKVIQDQNTNVEHPKLIDNLISSVKIHLLFVTHLKFVIVHTPKNFLPARKSETSQIKLNL